MTQRVLIFVRAPVPGQVKTRLARSLGDERALSIYRTMGRAVVDRLRAAPHPWRIEVWFTPNGSVETGLVADWLALTPSELHAQGEGTLGHRMEGAFAHAFMTGASKVCLVGSDIPHLDAVHLAEAFHALDRHADLVLGPCLDGGYYLIGMCAPDASLFQDIPWSTEAVLEETLRRARSAGLRIHLLPELRDVDEAEDLEAITKPGHGPERTDAKL
jgi:rSAM/selenodomain-associated transferase 1